MKAKEEQIHVQQGKGKGQLSVQDIDTCITINVSLHKSAEESRKEKSGTHTDGVLSQQPTNSYASQQIIDIKNFKGMEELHRRDSDTVVDKDFEAASNGNRQGVGICKTTDFSVPVGMDDLESELVRVVDEASEDQVMFDPCQYARGAATNTPVTGLTDYIFQQVRGRLTTPSRDNIYQHAMSIMKKCCADKSHTTPNTRKSTNQRNTPENIVEDDGASFPNFSLPAIVANMDEFPLGHTANCVLYVTQRRQQPIAPVKAWKGYKGNIYFEPVVCKKAGLTEPSSPRDNAHSYRLSMTNPAGRSKAAQPPVLPQKEVTSGQNPSPVLEMKYMHNQNMTVQSRQKSTAKSRVSTARQLAVLDKQSVFSKMDSSLPEDLKWISGLEAMGTLHVGGLKLPRSTAHFYENTRKHHKLRIQRGLVSHQLASNDNSLPTLLGIHGGRLNDSADSVAKTKHLQSQYQICRVPQQSVDDIFDSYSGPFTSIEQLRRDSPLSQRRGSSSCSSDRMIKDDSLHSMTSVYKHPRSTAPLYSSKEVLFRNREALFLTRPNYK